MKHVLIESGVVGNTTSEPIAGYVEVPDYVWTGDTTPDNGVTFYRGGALLKAPVPDIVPLWAFRAALVLDGVTQAQVDALIASLPEPAKTVATIQWNYGNYIERSHELIGQLGAAMGLTPEQIDNVFRTAATLK